MYVIYSTQMFSQKTYTSVIRNRYTIYIHYIHICTFMRGIKYSLIELEPLIWPKQSDKMSLCSPAVLLHPSKCGSPSKCSVYVQKSGNVADLRGEISKQLEREGEKMDLTNFTFCETRHNSILTVLVSH